MEGYCPCPQWAAYVKEPEVQPLHTVLTPEVPLASDAYWHSGKVHDGDGPLWEGWKAAEAISGKVHEAVSEKIPGL